MGLSFKVYLFFILFYLIPSKLAGGGWKRGVFPGPGVFSGARNFIEKRGIIGGLAQFSPWTRIILTPCPISHVIFTPGSDFLSKALIPTYVIHKAKLL